MISSYNLFFHTSGAISAHNGKWGQLKQEHVYFGKILSCFKIILEFRNQIKSAGALILSCSMHLRYTDPISKRSFSVTGATLEAVSACCMFSGLLLPSPRSILLLILLILLQDCTLPARAPGLYLLNGTCLGEEASSKQVQLLVVSSMSKITFTGRSCVW